MTITPTLIADFKQAMPVVRTLAGFSPEQRHLMCALSECDAELRLSAIELLEQLADGGLDEEQEFATTLIAEILFPNADETGAPGLDLEEAEAIAARMDPSCGPLLAEMDHQEATFADRLRELMAERGLTQAELAAKVGVGQPAIANMLGRTCRPQRKTVAKLATALGVEPTALWAELNS